jgi:tripartite-type tricarboxylate transporter receptor subunit TctC
VSSLNRIDILPDVPSIAEQGFADFQATTYTCLYAPAGTNPAIISTLQAATRRAVDAPDTRERFRASGIIPVGSTPEALAARIEKDFEKWGAVLRGMRDANGQP